MKVLSASGRTFASLDFAWCRRFATPNLSGEFPLRFLRGRFAQQARASPLGAVTWLARPATQATPPNRVHSSCDFVAPADTVSALRAFVVQRGGALLGLPAFSGRLLVRTRIPLCGFPLRSRAWEARGPLRGSRKQDHQDPSSPRIPVLGNRSAPHGTEGTISRLGRLRDRRLLWGLGRPLGALNGSCRLGARPASSALGRGASA